jgi:hypothetical protein
MSGSWRKPLSAPSFYMVYNIILTNTGKKNIYIAVSTAVPAVT